MFDFRRKKQKPALRTFGSICCVVARFASSHRNQWQGASSTQRCRSHFRPPSGANLQPRSFVVVESSAARSELRVAAETEEREFYEHRAPQEWLDALLPFGTDASKPFLETAPVLIAIFACSWMPLPDGRKGKHYYVSESVGIAAGFLIAALHQAGLATLTHTPSPMQFLNRILGRPDHERPYLLLVAGYPAADCQVPDITRRPFAESVFRV